jgi:Domain of unknown function (DUF4136)
MSYRRVARPTPGAAAVLLAVTTACTPVRVRTTAAPNAQFASLHTFAIATPTARRADAAPGGNDPMLTNSITNQALRQDLVTDFEAKGYTLDSAAPSFTVCYYASAQHRLDVADWDYGYPFWGPHRFWSGWGYVAPVAIPYTEGTVIVDVIDPSTKELVWRGQGKSDVSTDPTAYSQDVARTVRAIIAKFPAASGKTVAANN